MADWSKNNRACTTTWTTLMVLDQLKTGFDDAGGMKMSLLTFWNAADSGEMRSLKVSTLAIQMDNIFTMVRGAKYEEGKDKGSALQDIKNIMTSPDKTVKDLAAANDENYLFWQEAK